VNIETRVFGTVAIGPKAPYVKAVIQVNGHPQNCGLYIADEIADSPSHAQSVAGFIDDINKFDALARKILSQEFERRDSDIIDFLNFHLEELKPEIKGKLGVSKLNAKLLLDNLDLRALGFHLDEDGLTFGYDYCAGEEFSDELLVVKFDANGELLEVAHES
jgi:Protein of unknown function (DUF2004)